MSKYFKLPDVDYSRLKQVTRGVGKFVSSHKNGFLAVTIGGLLFDNIRVHWGRKKDRIEYEKNNLKHQEIERKHEVEIRVYKEQADQCQKAQKKVAVLEQIVENITADRGDSE